MISTVSAEDINSTNEIIDSNQDYSIDMSENNPDEEVSDPAFDVSVLSSSDSC